MRAVVYDAFGRLPQVRDIAPPACPPHGVLVAVSATGICRSDWHAWRGHDADVRLPHVPGHEFAGVIAEVGPAVRSAVVGQRVTAPFVHACGACEQCRDGDEQVCAEQTQPGFTHAGSFADLVAVHHADVNLVPLPGSVDSVSAAALGCRFATAYRAVVAQGKVRPGTWLAVHGCGGVGLAAVMIGVAHGARVVAVDVNPAARRFALDLGAEHALGPPAAEQIAALTGGGVHVSVDAIGRATTLADSLAGLRRRGRHVQVGLLVGADANPPTDMTAVLARELEIVGSHGMAAHAYPPMLAEIAAGRLQPARLVAKVIGLDEAPGALAGLGADGRPGMTVISLPTVDQREPSTQSPQSPPPGTR